MTKWYTRGFQFDSDITVFFKSGINVCFSLTAVDSDDVKWPVMNDAFPFNTCSPSLSVASTRFYCHGTYEAISGQHVSWLRWSRFLSFVKAVECLRSALTFCVIIRFFYQSFISQLNLISFLVIKRMKGKGYYLNQPMWLIPWIRVPLKS
jgi:hypothetical protein